ncbi:MAG: SDR family oxidoreductase [Ruminococcus sp.]|nr:SDR family oxidoreductase [Ruminococcus sp.]
MKALVTGASSGMGRDMARYLAEKGYDLILVARRGYRLEELRSELSGVSVRIIEKDLSIQENCFSLYDEVRDENVDFLINNAGFGVYGEFVSVPLEKELELINVNIRALHILTKLFLKDMYDRDSGVILNVGSAAGFLPGPTFSSYYASKNYVVRLTEAIHEEMRRRKKNIRVSALCPGPVNTEFNKVADVSFSVGGLRSEYVAKYAIDKALRGKMIITPGRLLKLTKFLEHFAGEKLLTRMSYNVQSRRKS